MIEKDDRVPNKKPQYKLKRVAENLYRMELFGTCYVMARRNRILFRQSLKTCDRQIAEQRLRDIIDKFARVVPGSGKMLFDDLCERWKATVLAVRDIKPKTRIDREQHVRMIYRTFPALKEMAIRDVTTSMCETWFAARCPRFGQLYLHRENLLTIAKLVLLELDNIDYVTL